MKLSSVYLQSLQNNIDKIANNMANTVTPGFKEQLLSLNESYDTQDKNNTVAQYGGMPATQNPVLEASLYLGKRFDFTQGILTDTGKPLDMAINGDGFFQVKTDNGSLAYTRAGTFSTDSAGNLVNNQGMLLEPPIGIPANASNIHVDDNGSIRGVLNIDSPDTNDYSSYYKNADDLARGIATFGNISLFKFSNPDGLELAGNNCFLPTQTSGKAVEGVAGEDGYGLIRGSTLERSNTDIVNAMTGLVQMQRVYELNLRLIQDQNEMSTLAIAMRG